MSRPWNPALLEAVRESMARLEAPSTRVRKLAEEFDCSQRTAKRYVQRVTLEIAKAYAAAAPHAAAVLMNDIAVSIEAARADGDHGAVMKGHAIKRAIIFPSGGQTINVGVGVQIGADGKPIDPDAPPDLSRLDAAALDVHEVILAQLAGDNLTPAQSAILGHLGGYLRLVGALMHGPEAERTAAQSALLGPSTTELLSAGAAEVPGRPAGEYSGIDARRFQRGQAPAADLPTDPDDADLADDMDGPDPDDAEEPDTFATLDQDDDA